MVAVFDAAFHASISDCASSYAIPRELAERHEIRRFGFHGISYSVLARSILRDDPDVLLEKEVVHRWPVRQALEVTKTREAGSGSA
jgi:acetate kinase